MRILILVAKSASIQPRMSAPKFLPKTNPQSLKPKQALKVPKDLAEADEDPAERHEVESRVAAEEQDELAHRRAERLRGCSFRPPTHPSITQPTSRITIGKMLILHAFWMLYQDRFCWKPVLNALFFKLSLCKISSVSSQMFSMRSCDFLFLSLSER